MNYRYLIILLLVTLLIGCTATNTPAATMTEAPAAEVATEATSTVIEPSPTLDETSEEITPTNAVEMTEPGVLPTGSNEVASQCGLAPIVVPTRPAITPSYTGLDESTGLHVTGTAVDIDLATYRLKVTGLVDNPLKLTYDDLRCMPKISATPELICSGYFVDVATWSGVPLAYVLEQAGVQSNAKSVVMIAADGYQNTYDLEEALKPQNFLAYEWEGQPLPILHGFPLRAVFPELLGYNWVKWLIEIKVI